jgi:hypothetical protein
MPTVYTPRGTVQPSALLLYAEGEAYADGHASSPEGGLRRGAMPRATVGVAYAEGNALYTDGYMPSAYSFIPVVGRGVAVDPAHHCSASIPSSPMAHHFFFFDLKK